MKNSFKVSYVTTLPKEGNAPRVRITGNESHTYSVMFFEHLGHYTEAKLISQGNCTNNQTIIAKTKQWFTEWIIKIFDESGMLVFTDEFDLQNEVVFIKLDAYALGDTLAWMPYVDEFRRKHNCKVICSSFHNDLFIDSYPDIMFVIHDIPIQNVYAQYYIGATNEDNPYYSPIKVNEHPLQDVASSILGLDKGEYRISLRNKYAHLGPKIDGKYVTLSEYGSDEKKNWKAENGWQMVVNFLTNKGYKVVVISKEQTNLTGIIDKSGNYSLHERAIDIIHAEFHLGISSGLSWFAWALDTHVVMISDVTPNWHEFQSNITRINANDLDSVNYLAEGQTTLKEVLIKLEELIVS